MRSTPHRPGLYAPELLEARIAPATFLVTSLLDNGADGTLRKEIADANLAPGADTIVFKLADPLLPHTIVLNGTEIAITGTLTIKGPGIDLLAVSGNNASRIFNIDDTDPTKLHPTTISGLTLIDGNVGAGLSGGAIRSTESLSLTKVVVHSSVADLKGGGIYVTTTGKVLIDNTHFTDNTATNIGGGLFANAAGGVLITRSLVSGNDAFGSGGMYLGTPNPKATIVIDATSFLGNSSVSSGGLFLTGPVTSKMTIKNSTFTGNTATIGNGGGLSIYNGLLSVVRTIFSGNSAAGSGGAIAEILGGGGLKIANSRFDGNSADIGGALYLRGPQPVTIAGSVFTGNKSTVTLGGAIHAEDGIVLTVKTSTFAGNSATTNGGAISLGGAGTSLVLATSTVSGNTGVHGGGLFANTGAKITVTGGVFSANAASGDGGGIATIGTGADAVSVSVAGTLFQGNRAANGGAADTDGDGTVLLKGVRVLGNHATSFGGGMYLRSSTSVDILGSLFQHNVAAGGDGGGLVIDLTLAAARAAITGTKILDNFAGDDSGGLAAFGTAGSMFTLKSSLISGNVAVTQAGGMRIGGTTVELIATIIAGNWAPTAPNIFP